MDDLQSSFSSVMKGKWKADQECSNNGDDEERSSLGGSRSLRTRKTHSFDWIRSLNVWGKVLEGSTGRDKLLVSNYVDSGEERGKITCSVKELQLIHIYLLNRNAYNI